MVDVPQALQLLFTQSPALALALFIWYYTNKDMLRLLQERREDAEAIKAERKQWIDDLRASDKAMMDDLRRVTDQYMAELKLAYETRTAVRAEMNEVKEKMTDLIHKVEMVLMRVDPRGVELKESDVESLNRK